MRNSSLRSTLLIPILLGLVGLGVLTASYLQRQSEPIVYAASHSLSRADDELLSDSSNSILDESIALSDTSTNGQEGAPAVQCPAQAGIESASGSTSAQSQPPILIDINSATAGELTLLPGIGPAYAERIIALRTQRSGFVYKEELLDVPGIGPARYAQLVDLVTIGPYTQSAHASVER